MNRNPKWRPPLHLWRKLEPLAGEKRHEPTPAEQRLWERLRNRQFDGAKFRRQHIVGKFILDFYCPEACLVIEVDGLMHEYTVEEDAIRQAYLENLGFRVLRFTNQEVLETMDKVIDQIRDAMAKSKTPTSPPLSEGERGPGGEV